MAQATRLYDKPRVGGDILANCTRCKMELAHVIVSMVDTQPAKIQCKTCKSERKYRRSGGGRTSSTKSSSPRRTRISNSAYWEEKLAANSDKDAKKYSPKESFVSNDILNHVKFGIGIVEESRGPGKILVLFREGERILIHELGKK